MRRATSTVCLRRTSRSLHRWRPSAWYYATPTYCGAVDLAAVLRWARSSVGPDLEGYRREFVRMVEEARHLGDHG